MSPRYDKSGTLPHYAWPVRKCIHETIPDKRVLKSTAEKLLPRSNHTLNGIPWMWFNYWVIKIGWYLNAAEGQY